MSEAPIKLLGAPGSPYSRKMRAALRYRRVPHQWVVRGGPGDKHTPKTPVALIPVLVLPGAGGAPDEVMIDSTFQLRRLEALHTERSLTPPDAALAFLDFLIEDFGDEWLTKAMFHYRWAYPEDVAYAAAVLPHWQAISAPAEKIAPLSKMFAERQVGRLGVVGSNETTGPVIEASYVSLLHALDALLQRQPFVMGNRPGTSDFALFGQLTQLVLFDPTPMAVARRETPRVVAWCDLIEDQSGLPVQDDDWISRDTAPETLGGLLALVGEYYTPFLVANAEALARGAEQVECTIAGRPWVQKPFPYQGKCLGWLREAHAALAPGDRSWVDGVLAGTGCEALFPG